MNPTIEPTDDVSIELTIGPPRVTHHDNAAVLADNARFFIVVIPSSQVVAGYNNRLEPIQDISTSLFAQVTCPQTTTTQTHQHVQSPSLCQQTTSTNHHHSNPSTRPKSFVVPTNNFH
eukprot:1025343_1